MLTSLYYYNYYKPFIFDKNIRFNYKNYIYYDHNNTLESYNNDSNVNNELSYFLNKSLNDNVKSYMFELSTNFNSLKNISNNISERLLEIPKEPLKNALKNFISIYNDFIQFLEKNISNSQRFKTILDYTKSIVESNSDILLSLGISIDSNGFLNIINNDNNLNLFNLDKKSIKKFYFSLYENTCDFMKDPMSNHMEFKDFSYYFNYFSDYNNSKSFKVIQRGILVDILL